MAASLVPTADRLPDVLPTERLNPRAKPTRALRDDLRRIPNVRNVFTTIGAVLQSFGVVIAAAVVHTWWAYLLAFVWMARGHVVINILGHEAAHRLLFSNRRVNDFCGKWLLSYPSLSPFNTYRRHHFAHHRDEMGPDEPDLGLYARYPIPADSWRRKLTRDAFGISAYKNVRSLVGAACKGNADAYRILAVQAAMLAAAVLTGRPVAYLVWIGSWASLWKVSNRLRAVAEHGGMARSKDRRQTTHVIRQTPLARFWMVPYNTGWHLAHHVDMGVPWRKLPALHAELVDAGWLTPDLEYPSYRAFWRAASSGDARQPAGVGQQRFGNSD